MARAAWIVLLTVFIACQSTDSSALYIDVRTPAEYAAGHVQGAVNIPHDQMADRWRELADHKDGRIVLYCRSRRRSALALQVLKANGFTHAEDGASLEGLTAAGVPLE